MVDSNDDELEWAWLAGLFEGEGCVNRYLVKRERPYKSTYLAIEMKDKDVLERALAITGRGTIRTKPARNNSAETFVWAVQNKDHVVEICERLLPNI